MLFAADSPQTVESTHESTSSGIASDVPAYCPPPVALSSFKGDHPGPRGQNYAVNGYFSDRNSQDSGTRTASWASSPHPKASTPTPMSGQQQYQFGHNHRLSPASPLAYKSATPPAHCYGSGSGSGPSEYQPREVDVEALRTRLRFMDFQDTAKVVRSTTKGKHPYLRPSPFERLTDDVLLKVFSHLPTDHLCRCARVCRRWYHLVWDPSLWTSIVINNSAIEADRVLKYLTRRLSYNTPKVCVILERVNLNGCEQLTDKGLHTVAKRCPELRYLEVQGCTKLTNLGVFEAVSYCVNLEHLDVTGVCVCLLPHVLFTSCVVLVLVLRKST